MASNRRVKLATSSPGQWKVLKPVARQLRADATLAEQLLWEKLRNRKLGSRFRRQHAVGRYVVDFFHVETGLVIELDGPVHEGREREDEKRESVLKELGYRVLRFKNDQVFDAMSQVIEQIRAELKLAPRTSSPSPVGRGGRGVR